MNCLLLVSAAVAFAPTRHLQRLPSAAPITQPRVALAPTALRYADAGSEPQEAPRTAPLQQLRQKLQTYINKARIFIKSEDGRKITGVAAFIFIALLLRALGGMVAAPPAPKRAMPALNFVWNHGEGATLAWRQGEPLKFIWRHGEYVWHVIRPAGRRPYLYLAGAP
ncbi:unnamed protein product [Pelagomonas calceolata]|uniref:Uncharacterized protein n=1 Tax=Pelagomonas calceolata TaxID=35677 RepID=A0A7S4A434_9STRA|nr:unnamed protein product [Pelagomonas calceolata]|mmetsp:Transcript_223/g.796  ORF Transcript_223/g.796 Transcript_223/m.796 type:complete len:167 (+) Transcript_223:129-629(+)